MRGNPALRSIKPDPAVSDPVIDRSVKELEVGRSRMLEKLAHISGRGFTDANSTHTYNQGRNGHRNNDGGNIQYYNIISGTLIRPESHALCTSASASYP